MPSPLVIGSCEPFSGKSSVLLGLARGISDLGLKIAIGKPLATCLDAGPPGTSSEPPLDADIRFMAGILGLGDGQIIPSLHRHGPGTAQTRLLEGDVQAGEGFRHLKQRLAASDDVVALLEAPGNLYEGVMFGLSLAQLASGLEASVVLVQPWKDCRSVEALVAARHQLGERLAGVILNVVDPDLLQELHREVGPALEQLGLPVLGMIPRSPLLSSVSVAELARRLEAKVLCCRERLDLMVETLSIGAMNVNAAMEFFRRRRNMAVVTGADRTDIQLAALEASTQCLILTGVGDPLPQLISRAEELEVPVLKVEHDTLTTVEVVDAAIGHGRLHEPVKAGHAIKHVNDHCHFDRLFERLPIPVTS